MLTLWAWCGSTRRSTASWKRLAIAKQRTARGSAAPGNRSTSAKVACWSRCAPGGSAHDALPRPAHPRRVARHGRSMRYLAYVKRMRQPAKEADPRAWLEAMERGDLGDPDE